MHGHSSRGPSPLRPGLMSGQASFRPEEMSPIDSDMHPVVHAGRVAVVTGAASGIGRAAAREFAKLGLRVAIADVNATVLAEVENEIKEIQKSLPPDVAKAAAAHTDDPTTAASSGPEIPTLLVVPTDVSVLDEVVRLRDRVYETWGEVAVLLNNAGIGSGPEGTTGTSWSSRSAWDAVFAVNLFGMLNVQQTFVSSMIHQENNAAVINTGSKQGITNPPGNAAYNASKAAVKSMTEGLAHELRQRGENVTAHLFVPGWTFTGMTAQSGAEKPAGAWTAEETVLYMLDRVRQGDFYILCPDNETRPAVDALRIMWAAGDITEGRPALSRWHPMYKSLFEEYMRDSLAEMQ